MIKAAGIEKSFGSLKVLKGVDIDIAKAEVVSIMGASGAGKSTLLQILGTLSTPDSGSLVIDGVDVLRLDSIKQLTLNTRMPRGSNVHKLYAPPGNELDGKYIDFASTTSTFLAIANLKKAHQINLKCRHISLAFYFVFLFSKCINILLSLQENTNILTIHFNIFRL